MDSYDMNPAGLALGDLLITESVLTSMALTLALTTLAWLATRHLRMKPGTLQTILEGTVATICRSIEGVQPQHVRQLLPLIATLWIFLVCANLVGLVPGLHSPSEDLSFTAALAIIVFFSVHWYGIRISGLNAYLRHYLSPTPIMLPFHLMSEITRTLALALRLFGNMMSLDMAALLVLLVAGFLVPVPILMLHVVEALVQAYIFGMLALIYIASGLQQRHTTTASKQGEVHD